METASLYDSVLAVVEMGPVDVVPEHRVEEAWPHPHPPSSPGRMHTIVEAGDQ